MKLYTVISQTRGYANLYPSNHTEVWTIFYKSNLDQITSKSRLTIDEFFGPVNGMREQGWNPTSFVNVTVGLCVICSTRIWYYGFVNLDSICARSFDWVSPRTRTILNMIWSRILLFLFMGRVCASGSRPHKQGTRGIWRVPLVIRTFSL